MGYERKGASFNFMGFVPVGKTVRVVEDVEETPVMMRPPLPAHRSIDGTVGMSAEEFVRERRARRFTLG